MYTCGNSYSQTLWLPDRHSILIPQKDGKKCKISQKQIFVTTHTCNGARSTLSFIQSAFQPQLPGLPFDAHGSTSEAQAFLIWTQLDSASIYL